MSPSPEDPIASPTPPITNVCIPAPNTSDLTNARAVASTLYIAQLTQSGLTRVQENYIHHGQSKVVGDWYAYYTTPGRSITEQDVLSAWSNLGFTCTGGNTGGSGNCRYMNNLLEDVTTDGDCPVRITGGSPTIFVYGTSGDTVEINPSSIKYAEPGLTKGVWSVKIKNEGTFEVSNTIRNSLYYEYNSVSFDKPQAGWIVKKRDLSSFVSTVSSQLKLTPKEQERLLFELNFASSSVASDTLFVGLIDKDEIDKKLPLKVTGIDKALRLHFYVAPADRSVKAPKISPIDRSSPFILELGAAAGK